MSRGLWGAIPVAGHWGATCGDTPLAAPRVLGGASCKERGGVRGVEEGTHTPRAPLGLKVHGEDGHCGAAVTPGYSGAIAQMALTCWGRWGCRGCGGCGGRGGCGSGGPLWGRAGRELRPQLLVLILKPSGFLYATRRVALPARTVSLTQCPWHCHPGSGTLTLPQ